MIAKSAEYRPTVNQLLRLTKLQNVVENIICDANGDNDNSYCKTITEKIDH